MIWTLVDEYHMVSEPSGYVINKAMVSGRLQYMAVKLGTPWKRNWKGETSGWDDSSRMHIERDIDPNDNDARLAALRRCKALCEDDANVGHPVP